MHGSGVMHRPPFSSSSLPQLQSQLATWRRRQSGRPRLPVELWKSAAVLAQIHGVSRVSRTLGLGFHRLRRLSVDEKAGSAVRRSSSQAGASPSFVELPWPPVASAVAAERPVSVPRLGAVELISPSQRRLRIELALDADLVLQLAENFWSRPA